MDDTEQARRERAYRLWEEEGRPDGRHLDHWQHAEDQHEATERAAELEVEQQASEKEKKSEVPPTAPPTKKVIE